MAEPQKLYNAPNNLFVAASRQSRMNIVEADVMRGDGGFAVRIGDQELPVPRTSLRRRPALSGYAGSKARIGTPRTLEDSLAERWRPPESPACVHHGGTRIGDSRRTLK